MAGNIQGPPEVSGCQFEARFSIRDISLGMPNAKRYESYFGLAHCSSDYRFYPGWNQTQALLASVGFFCIMQLGYRAKIVRVWQGKRISLGLACKQSRFLLYVKPYVYVNIFWILLRSSPIRSYSH